MALGLDPTSPDEGGLPTVTSEYGFLTRTLTKHPGVSYEVQSAGTLAANAQTSFSATTTSVLANTATMLKGRDDFLIGECPARYMRLKATAAP